MSVSVTYLVEDAVFPATFFSSTDALRDFVSDLMLHVIREKSAANGDVKLIFASTCGTGTRTGRLLLAAGRHPGQ